MVVVAWSFEDLGGRGDRSARVPTGTLLNTTVYSPKKHPKSSRMGRFFCFSCLL